MKFILKFCSFSELSLGCLETKVGAEGEMFVCKALTVQQCTTDVQRTADQRTLGFG